MRINVSPSLLFVFLLVALFCPLSLSEANALTLDEAKEQNLVGEQVDGYLGSPTKNPSSEVQSLIKEINEKRRAKYEAIAKKNNTKVAEVEKLAAKKAIELTESGHSYRNKAGDWKVK